MEEEPPEIRGDNEDPARLWHGKELLLDPHDHLSINFRTGKAEYPIHSTASHADLVLWWRELQLCIKDLIEEAGFKPFLDALPHANLDKELMYALAERWWDTTNTFHLPLGEITLTPADYSAITGLRVGGEPLPLDLSANARDDYISDMLGWVPNIDANGYIKLSEIWYYRNKHATHHMNENSVAQWTRTFLLYMFGRTLFANPEQTVSVGILPALAHIDSIKGYNWGGAGMATLYKSMSDVSRMRTDTMSGFAFIWEVWAYEVLQLLPYNLFKEEDQCFPRMWRWRSSNRRCRHGASCLGNYRVAIECKTGGEVSWRPWDRFNLPDDWSISNNITSKRLLLFGPCGWVYYLGDRVCRQIQKHDALVQPSSPPFDMLFTGRIKGARLEMLSAGVEASTFYPSYPQFVSYQHFIQNMLMPPLTRKGIKLMNKNSTSSLEKPFFRPPSWTVPCVQADGRIKEEKIDVVTGHAEGLLLPPDCSSVPTGVYEQVVRQNMGLRYKIAEKGAEICKLAGMLGEFRNLVEKKLYTNVCGSSRNENMEPTPVNSLDTGSSSSQKAVEDDLNFNQVLCCSRSPCESKQLQLQTLRVGSKRNKSQALGLGRNKQKFSN